MKRCHRSAQAGLTLALVSALVLVFASAQAKTSNPLVGKWSAQADDLLTVIEFRPDGTEVYSITNLKTPFSYTVTGHYQVRGGTVVGTFTKMITNGKVVPVDKSHQKSQTTRFRISGGKLTLIEADGSVGTLKKVP